MQNKLAYLFLVLACSFWGMAYISAKVCLTWFDPYSLTQYRFTIATVVLLLLAALQKSSLKVARKDLVRIGLCGLFGITIFYVLNTLSLVYISASISAIIGATIPLLAAVLEVFIERKPPSMVTVCCVLLSVFGVYLMVGLQADYASNDLFTGVITALAASVAFVVYTFLAAPLQGKYPISTVTFYQSLIAVVFCFALLPRTSVPWSALGLVGWGNLVFLGVFCSAGCYFMYNFAVCRLPVVVCTLFINAMPIVAIITSAVIFSEKLGLIQLFGAALVIVSVVWMSISKTSAA